MEPNFPAPISPTPTGLPAASNAANFVERLVIFFVFASHSFDEELCLCSQLSSAVTISKCGVRRKPGSESKAKAYLPAFATFQNQVFTMCMGIL